MIERIFGFDPKQLHASSEERDQDRGILFFSFVDEETGETFYVNKRTDYIRSIDKRRSDIRLRIYDQQQVELGYIDGTLNMHRFKKPTFHSLTLQNRARSGEGTLEETTRYVPQIVGKCIAALIEQRKIGTWYSSVARKEGGDILYGRYLSGNPFLRVTSIPYRDHFVPDAMTYRVTARNRRR